MPKITFEKEVSEAQYEVFQMVLKLQETTSDDFIWDAVVNVVVAELESATSSPLYEKTGFGKTYQSTSKPGQDQQ
jgi:hypothetical protein